MADSITRKLIIAEAKKRGFKVSFVGRIDFFCKVTDQYGHSEIFLGSRPLKSSANGLIISIHKDLTMDYVRSLGYEVPACRVVGPETELPLDFLVQHKRLVVKPNDGEQSIGVTTDVVEANQLSGAIDLSIKLSRFKKVMLQEQLDGQLYRLFVINGKLVAAAKREAPYVIGDGKLTVHQLIEEQNQDPRRGDDDSTPLKRIKLTDVEAYIGKSGLESIPDLNEQIKVSAIDSVSAGGQATDVTDSVHSDWARATADISKQADLYVCGFDVICEDITQPLRGNYLPLLEINSSPGLKLHQFPTGGGKPINLAEILLDELFGIAKNT